MAEAGGPSATDRVLAEEREFILALGGFTVEIAGARLLTHERVPVPRFNFVEVHNVGRERQAAFFERALDHYFQRALRPTFRIRRPAPPHLDAGLRKFGFRPSPSSLTVLTAPPVRDGSGSGPFRVVEVGPEELARIVPFWTDERERDELGRSIDVLVHHPNPSERLVPLIAQNGEEDVSAALVYSDGRTAGIHMVATEPKARGAGAASALVRYALGHATPDAVDLVGMVVDHPRIARRLVALGFEEVGSLDEYVLPRDVELAMPSPGPPTPPRWRPPRRGARAPGATG